MNRYFIKYVIVLTIVLFVYLLLSEGFDVRVLKGVHSVTGLFKHYFLASPLVFIIFFMISHLVAGGLCLPGGCTFLNILAGATLGFWKGSLVVYAATMSGALLFYYIGKKLRLPSYFEKKIFQLGKSVEEEGLLVLVSLRLSPILPFGALNLLMGRFKVPLKTYLLSTFVGTFFDVFILTAAGAALSSNNALSFDFKSALLIMFFIILIFFRFIFSDKITSNKRVDL